MGLIDLSSLFAASDEQMMWRVRAEDDAEAFGKLVVKWEKHSMNAGEGVIQQLGGHREKKAGLTYGSSIFFKVNSSAFLATTCR